MGLAAAAATGLPPFGLFFSELTVLSGGFAAGHTLVSTLVLAALLASFCGILYQLTRILPGTPKIARTGDAAALDGVPAMGLMLGALVVFSVWLPLPLLEVMERASDIIGGCRHERCLPELQPALADLTERFSARIRPSSSRPNEVYFQPNGTGPGLLRPALQEVERPAGQPLRR